MIACPHCGGSLVGQTGGFIWSCPECRGCGVGHDTLVRKLVPAKVLEIWDLAGNAPASTRPCFSCGRNMNAVRVWPTLEVDACLACHVVWFDSGELERLPVHPGLKVPVTRVESSDQDAWFTFRDWDDVDPRGWLALFAFLGCPILEGDAVEVRRPWVTRVTAACMVAITLVAALTGWGMVEDWGLRWSEPWRHGGLTWISSFLLHAGWVHLLGNGYFLLVFGEDVEDHLGNVRFFALLAVSTLAGDLLQGVFSADPDIVSVGASGGIAGVLAFFALQFPRVRVHVLWMWMTRSAWLRMPASIGFVVWIIQQVIGSMTQMVHATGVGYLAHLGGALAGIAFWYGQKGRQHGPRA